MKQPYKQIWDHIKNQEKITLCTHINTDGDTIGSSIALKHLILDNTNVKEVKISGEKYPQYLNFLEPNDLVDDHYFNNSLKIVVDTSTKSRIFDKRVITEEAIKIDHHHKEGNWLMEIGGDHWPATGQVIYEMCKELDLKVSNRVKEALFVSIWTDTEGMTERNINAVTHEALEWLDIDKKLLLSKMELPNEVKNNFEFISKDLKSEKIVSWLFTREEVSNDWYRQFVKLVNDKANNEVLIIGVKDKDRIRVGIRSKKDSNIDVSKFASNFGGGGHFNSSGYYCDNEDDFYEKVKIVLKEINND